MCNIFYSLIHHIFLTHSNIPVKLLLSHEYHLLPTPQQQDGVGALKSAKISYSKVRLMSNRRNNWCVGIKYCLSATISSLNAHKSSIEPPPRPIIITSNSIKSNVCMPFTILFDARFPEQVLDKESMKHIWVASMRKY